MAPFSSTRCDKAIKSTRKIHTEKETLAHTDTTGQGGNFKFQAVYNYEVQNKQRVQNTKTDHKYKTFCTARGITK